MTDAYSQRLYDEACIEAAMNELELDSTSHQDNLHGVALAHGFQDWNALRADCGMGPALAGVMHIVAGSSVKMRPRITTLDMDKGLAKQWIQSMGEVVDLENGGGVQITCDVQDTRAIIKISEWVDHSDKHDFLERRAVEGAIHVVAGTKPGTLPIRSFLLLAALSRSLPKRFSLHAPRWQSMASTITWLPQEVVADLDRSLSTIDKKGRHSERSWMGDYTHMTIRWDMVSHLAAHPNDRPPEHWTRAIAARPDAWKVTDAEAEALIAYIDDDARGAGAGEGRRLVEAYRGTAVYVTPQVEANEIEKGRREDREAVSVALPDALHLNI